MHERLKTLNDHVHASFERLLFSLMNSSSFHRSCHETELGCIVHPAEGMLKMSCMEEAERWCHLVCVHLEVTGHPTKLTVTVYCCVMRGCKQALHATADIIGAKAVRGGQLQFLRTRRVRRRADILQDMFQAPSTTRQPASPPQP